MRAPKQQAVARVALACCFPVFFCGSLSAFAQATRCGSDLQNAVRAESARYVVVYAPTPAPIAVSKHFAMDIVVCAKPGAPAPQGLRLDAVMPEHNHGMNYKPGVVALGKGRYNADGLMLHMPGRWDFVFDVQTGGASERVTASLALK